MLTVRTLRTASRLASTALLALALSGLAAALAQAPRPEPSRIAKGSIPEPRFADPARARKLATAFPEIERLFTAWVGRQRMPGAAIGIVIDGELAWVMTAGVADVARRTPVTPDTVFRIASMTKSVTAMAILRLRDEGKLSLDDPVARYVPELGDLSYPTRDSLVVTIRHLLTHSEGFPEDNPWGDRQLAQSSETLSAWMRGGIPFSNAPGMAFEYSNYGFAILGQVVARVSTQPYPDYVTTNILRPLGMRASTYQAKDIPADRMARGYGREDNGWKEEPPLADGAFASMGGLWTSARDLARWVAFLMSAYPPRDAPETGPIRRSSTREMQQAWRSEPASARRRAVDAPLQLDVASYGYGLRVSQDCEFRHIVDHGGGLPGYGSLMEWLPEHGVGLIALGNVTYASFRGLFRDSFAALGRTGALQPRAVQPSPALVVAKVAVSRLIVQWDDQLASRIAADNLFLDEPAERRKASYAALAAKHGACRPEAEIDAENALRGTWRMMCERGWLTVAVSLAPTMPPRVQSLRVRSVLPPDERMAKVIDAVRRLAAGWDAGVAQSLVVPGFDIDRMKRQLAAVGSYWGACRIGETVGGDGTGDSVVRLACDRGPLVVSFGLDPTTGKLTHLDVMSAGDRACVP